MAEIMEMLALSPTMEEGVLAEWLKQEGDTVEEGEVLAEVETDKATMEMESFHSGTILKLFVDAGATVTVGDPLVVIGEEGEDISDLVDGAQSGGPAPQKAADDGDGDSDKEEDDKAQDDEKAKAAGAEEPSTATDGEGGRIKSSPLARRIAQDKGVALEAIDGSGPGGRIIKRDVESAIEAGVGEQDGGQAPQAAVAGVLDNVGDLSFVDGETERLSQMRKTIAKRLVGVWQTTPHFYLTRSIDMGPLMARRAEINEQLKASEAGVKLSVNDLIVKACATALANYPDMNVAFTKDGLYRFAEVNIGVAVAVDAGLITPTVRHADTKSVGSISREIRELAGRAREGKLAPEEYGAHTFSVSNLGMYDIDDFLAVINAPDAGILACGAVKDVPVVEDGELAVGTRMKVSLACDHRAVDGAVGAEFLAEVVTLLENPMMLLV